MFRLVSKFFNNQRIHVLRCNSTTNWPIPEISPDVEAKRLKDMPMETNDNPFARKVPKCVLCRYKVKIDFRNVRLLSQFVSSFSGKVYGRHVSGLCERQQALVERAVARARSCGLMPYYHKDLIYMRDPELFDPERPFKAHKY